MPCFLFVMHCVDVLVDVLHLIIYNELHTDMYLFLVKYFIIYNSLKSKKVRVAKIVYSVIMYLPNQIYNLFIARLHYPNIIRVEQICNDNLNTSVFTYVSDVWNLGALP